MTKEDKRSHSSTPAGACWEFSPWQECLALLPYRIGTKTVAAGAGYAGSDVAAKVEHGRPAPIGGGANERRRLYEALLEVPGLEPEIRRVVLDVLGRGAQAENTDFERGRTLTLRHMVNEVAARMGWVKGSRTAAIAEIAENAGIGFEALKRRLERFEALKKG
jgi:hypothetical protein